jgi:hypothetical protein
LLLEYYPKDYRPFTTGKGRGEEEAALLESRINLPSSATPANAKTPSLVQIKEEEKNGLKLE